MGIFDYGSPFHFLYTQLFVTPRLPKDVSFAGQTAIVTGSNVGLGKDAARQIASLGAAKVIIAVRSVKKGEEAAEEIQKTLPASSRTKLEVWPLDLGSTASIKEFAARANNLERLDVLLENAGIATGKMELVEGHESTIQVNVIGTFLLALLLLPKLRETAETYKVLPHVAIVSSEVAHMAKFEESKYDDIFAALSDEKRANMSDRYLCSKVLEAIVVRELASQFSAGNKPKVVINYSNPGFCESALRRNVKSWSMMIMEFFLQRKTELGSRNFVYAASQGEKTQGKYVSDCHLEIEPPLCRGEEGAKLQKRVWKDLAGILEEIQPGITENV